MWNRVVRPLPESRIRVAEISHHLKAVELHIARGKEVSICEKDAAITSRGCDAGPAGQSGSVRGEPAGGFVKRPSIDQGSAKRRGGGK